MRVGLVDIDSKIPNLALMKLSAYWKSNGAEVEMTSPLFAEEFDKVFASQVFDYTETPRLPENTVIGGSGVSLSTTLDGEVESMKPDYSLYGVDYSLGFTSRGCSRRCTFCVVPKKEGKAVVVGDVYSMLNENSFTLFIWDNAE